jgi:hypothetical protein
MEAWALAHPILTFFLAIPVIGWSARILFELVKRL